MPRASAQPWTWEREARLPGRPNVCPRPLPRTALPCCRVRLGARIEGPDGKKGRFNARCKAASVSAIGPQRTASGPGHPLAPPLPRSVHPAPLLSAIVEVVRRIVAPSDRRKVEAAVETPAVGCRARGGQVRQSCFQGLRPQWGPHRRGSRGRLRFRIQKPEVLR